MDIPKILLSCFGCISTAVVTAQISIAVYFNSGSANSGVNLQHTLDSTITFLQTQQIDHIDLHAFCDTDGDSLFNIRLSEKRNVFVKKVLQSSGIQDSIFSNINAFGENKTKLENGDEVVKQQNRRVDIIIHLAANNSNIAIDNLNSITAMAAAILNAEIGEKVVIPNLEFYSGRHTLMPESQPVLQELVKIMQDNPNLYISLIGHICCMTEMQKQMGAYRDGFDADDGTNHLSLNRAIVVKTYLTDFGIASERILVKGKGGAEKLIDPEITEADKKRNRRVEVMIIAK